MATGVDVSVVAMMMELGTDLDWRRYSRIEDRFNPIRIASFHHDNRRKAVLDFFPVQLREQVKHRSNSFS